MVILEVNLKQYFEHLYFDFLYIQLGVHIKAFYSKEYGKFHREIDEVCEFYVDDDNVPKSRIIYQKIFGKPMMCKPSDHLIEYIENQNIEVKSIIEGLPDELPIRETMEAEKNIENNSSAEVASPQPVVQQVSTNVVETPTISSEPTINPVPLAPTVVQPTVAPSTLTKLEG